MTLTTIIALVLAGPNVRISEPLTTLVDGGVGVQVTCDNCSSGAGPGGGLTNTELRATPVPVSGSLTCAVASTTITGSVATTGTFFQATQPVSLATVPAHGVTGTFWQATQPVSIASMPSTPVTGTFYQATQPVSIASLPALATGANVIGSAKITDGIDTAQVTATSGGAIQVECVAGCGSPAIPVTYVYQTPDAVGGANKLHLDIFNAVGSGKLMRILGIYPAMRGEVAVVGVVSIRWDLFRTSAVGTGGTAASYKSPTPDIAGGSIHPRDTNNAALPVQITARHLPAGGATISEWMDRGMCFTEETNAATYICGGQTNFLETGNWTAQHLTIREGQGLLIKQGAVASLNNIAFNVVFSLE